MYLIQKPSAAGPLWLKRAYPTLNWGPREHAMEFPTKGAARETLSRLIPKERETATVERVTPA